MAAASGIIFAKFADMQELNPFLWGLLGVLAFAGPPSILLYRGAGWNDLPLVWGSPFIALFLLFIVQSLIAARKRFSNR